MKKNAERAFEEMRERFMKEFKSEASTPDEDHA